MPVYRTRPDVSLDDLVGQIQDRDEKIIASHRLPEGEWVLITEVRGEGRLETRPA